MKTLVELKKHSGKEFKRTVVGNIQTVETWDEYSQAIKKDAESQGFNPVYEENGDLAITDTQVLRKPKMKKHTQGILKFRSKGYTFTVDGIEAFAYDSIKKDQLIENGFEVRIEGRNPYTLRYELV